MSTDIIGYSAASISVIAFGAQFFHTLRCGSVEGLSLGRTIFDTVSLVLWVAYATRVEDIPLLIATSCELVMCMCVAALIVQEKMRITLILDNNKDTNNPVVIHMTGINYVTTIGARQCAHSLTLSNHKTPQLLDEGKMPPV
jgi:uncharacterized protein with PQ loop repeat